jgi:hypothetical protein
MVSATGQLDTARHSGIYNERQVVVYSPRYAKRAREEREHALKKPALYVGTKSTDARDSTYGKLKYVKKTPLKDGEKQDADAYIDLSRKFLRQIDIRMLLAQTKKIS